jgi:hypothetical protein
MKTSEAFTLTLEVRVVVLVEDVHMAHGRFDQSLGGRLTVLALQVLAQGSRIDADANRDSAIAGRGYHLADLVVAADIAGIDTQAIDAVFRDLECNAMVEVDIGDQRDRACARISRKASAASILGTEIRTMSAPACLKASICATVAATSQVSVLVMLCTLIGASPPTATLPT